MTLASNGTAEIGRIKHLIRAMMRGGRLSGAMTTRDLAYALRVREVKPRAIDVTIACQDLDARGVLRLERRPANSLNSGGRPSIVVHFKKRHETSWWTTVPDMQPEIATRLHECFRIFERDYGALFDTRSASQRALHRKLLIAGLERFENEQRQNDPVRQAMARPGKASRGS